MANVKEIVESMPEKPGIYIMKNIDGTVIYVGKAKRLKRRVKQYFTSTESKGIKTVKLVSNINDIEYIVTDSEEEALILECNFIKKYMPRYNILLKDGKTYPYIKITTNERFPRLVYTRYVEKDGSKYFGPYPDGEHIKSIIELLSNEYKIRKCNTKSFTEIKRTCVNYDIGICSGPCKAKVSHTEYLESIQKVIEFLEGNHKDILERLKAKMEKYSEEYKFEEAAKIRDMIASITNIKEKQKITNVYEKDKDYIAIARDNTRDIAIVQIFTVRNGKFLDRKHLLFEELNEVSNEELLLSFIEQYYVESFEYPCEILVDENIEKGTLIDDYAVLEKTISKKAGYKIKIYNPKVGKNKKLLLLARKNASILLNQHIAKTYQKNDGILEELSETLNISMPINRVESYDISNISGVDNVAAMVVFENNDFNKSQYRKFKIKSVSGANDIGCMKEVLYRRFKRYTDGDNKFIRLPDLIMMDGGVNQVNAALEIISKFKLDVKVCGMIKDDKHKTNKLYYNGKEIVVDKKSKVFLFATRLQDEVHNSAISYFKKVHNRNMIKSQLDDIPGIGEVRKIALINHFKSVENIKNATVEELITVEGINEKMAIAIKDFFSVRGK